MYLFLAIFKVFAICFRLPILVIAFVDQWDVLILNYMYKEFLIRIKDRPSCHLLFQSQQ